MTGFGTDQAGHVLAQCQSATETICSAFSAAFGGEFQAQAAEPAQLNLDELPENLAGAGLIFRIALGEIALGDTQCLALLGQLDGLLPDWWTEPDDDGSQRLNQLGIDLTTAMLPSESNPEFTGVSATGDLAAAIRDSQPTGESVCLAMEIAGGGAAAHLALLWPVANSIDAVTSGAKATSAAKTAAKATSAANEHDVSQRAAPGGLPKHRRLIYRNLEDGIRQLPAYAQSLLRVQVPVTVTLAATKTPVSKILDMGPGTILQFKKSCDSNLTLEVGSQTVAEGEAVKVGDKFGLWITSMTMPGERFWSVNKNATAKRVK